MEVTSAGIVALPVQSFCCVTTLFVIVNVPPIEHATVVVAACATVPCNPNKIMLMRRSDTIRKYIFFLAQNNYSTTTPMRRGINSVCGCLIILAFQTVRLNCCLMFVKLLKIFLCCSFTVHDAHCRRHILRSVCSRVAAFPYDGCFFH